MKLDYFELCLNCLSIYFKNIVLSDNERKALLELTALKIQGNIKYENIVNTSNACGH
jgi:hypothetical protein